MYLIASLLLLVPLIGAQLCGPTSSLVLKPTDVVFTNNGPTDVQVNSVQLQGPDAGHFTMTAPEFPATVPRGDTLSVKVEPVGTQAGSKSAFLSVVQETNSATFQLEAKLVGYVELEPTFIGIINEDVPLDTNGDPESGYAHNELVFQKIWDPIYVPEQHDTVTFRIVNNSPDKPLEISNMNITEPGWEFTERVEFPVTIEPQTELSLIMVFNLGYEEKGIKHGYLVIESNDPTMPEYAVNLWGQFMQYPEQDAELTLNQIGNGFGYKLDIYNPTVAFSVSGEPDSTLNRDEVRSKKWIRAESAKPMFVRQLAAFKTCCLVTGVFEIDNTDLVVESSPQWNQAMYPKKNGDPTSFAEDWFNIQGEFSFSTGNGDDYSIWSTDTDGQMGTKVWALREKNGAIMRNTYIVGQDLIYGGCMGEINCDFNDNVFMMNGVKPADSPILDLSHFVPLTDESLTLDFEAAKAGTMAGTGFVSVQINNKDVTAGTNSFQPDLLKLGSGKLTVTSSPGTNHGEDANADQNNLVNGLLLRFDASSEVHAVTAVMTAPLGEIRDGEEEAGIFVGNTKDNYVTLGLAGNNGNPVIQFYAEVDTMGEVVSTAPVSDPDDIESLELRLIGNPLEKTFTATYKINDDEPITMDTVWDVNTNNSGYWFGIPSHAGIYVSHKNGAPFTVSYESFTVASYAEEACSIELTSTSSSIPDTLESGTTKEDTEASSTVDNSIQPPIDTNTAPMVVMQFFLCSVCVALLASV